MNCEHQNVEGFVDGGRGIRTDQVVVEIKSTCLAEDDDPSTWPHIQGIIPVDSREGFMCGAWVQKIWGDMPFFERCAELIDWYDFDPTTPVTIYCLAEHGHEVLPPPGRKP